LSKESWSVGGAAEASAALAVQRTGRLCVRRWTAGDGISVALEKSHGEDEMRKSQAHGGLLLVGCSMAGASRAGVGISGALLQ